MHHIVYDIYNNIYEDKWILYKLEHKYNELLYIYTS